MLELVSPRRLAATGVIALCLGIATAWLLQTTRQPADTRAYEGLLWPPVRKLEGFSLLEHSGNAFTPASLQGKWSLLFFGFTHCPDLCPNTLRLLQRASARFPANTQVVFISVDPGRDTPQTVADYVSYFDPAFVGVTGTAEAIDAFTHSLGIVAMRGPESSVGDYTVDHTASVFVIDPQGQMVGMISQPFTDATLSKTYLNIRSFVEQQTQ